MSLPVTLSESALQDLQNIQQYSLAPMRGVVAQTLPRLREKRKIPTPARGN